MKKLFSLFFLSLFIISAHAAVLLVEDFDYVAGTALEGQGSPNKWSLSTNANNAQTASAPLVISSDGLTMPYYGAGEEAKGLGVMMPVVTLSPDASRQRVTYRMFDTNSGYKTGCIYAAFLLKVSEASSTARDFFSFEGNTGTTQRGRLFVKAVGGGYQLGVSRTSTSPVWSRTLELGKTYFVVLKYELVPDALNDVVSLYVDFPLGYAETSSAVRSKMVESNDFDSGYADPSQLKAVSFKQRENGSVVQMSHLRVATTWDEAVNYTGPSLEPEDLTKPIYHFTEGFDTNGNWTIINVGASTKREHGDYGSTSRSLTFNKTADSDRCNGSQVISPAVNTAGVLRFFLIGSSNETRGNIRVSKIIGKDTTELAYIEGPFGKQWVEYMVLVRDVSDNIKVMLEVSDCGLGAGSLYIDDISLTNYVPAEAPKVGECRLTVPFPSANNPTSIEAVVTNPSGRKIAEVALLWGYDSSVSEGRIPMRVEVDSLYSSAPIPARVKGKAYYRIVAFDSHYLSDTSAVFSYDVYGAYTHCVRPGVVLGAGEEWRHTSGLDGVRISFSNAGGAMQLGVKGGNCVETIYSAELVGTTGDLALSVEPGTALVLRNAGTGDMRIDAVEYNDFRPIVFTCSPRQLQLYPRSEDGTAVVRIAGKVQQSGVSSLQFTMYRNGESQRTNDVTVAADGSFDSSFTIRAEKALYKFAYTMGSVSGVLADSVVAGDVYVIAGQSNGAASASGNPGVTNAYWRNFGCVQKTEVYNPADTLWGLSNSAGWGYGRAFYNGYSGYVLQRELLESQGIPTAVLNIAIGGSSLNQNLPNPSNREDLSTFYGEGLYRLRKSGLAEHVKAIIWVQGESDQNGLYEDYGVRLEKLYQAWKEDYPNVKRVYISQINVGCGTSTYASEIREIQRRMSAAHDDITVITNIGIPIRYDSCHYLDEGYERLYGQYARLIEQDFYGKSISKAMYSPNVKSVNWTDDSHSAIAIRFDQEMVWPAPMWGRDMKDYFYNENEERIVVNRGYVDNTDSHCVVLELAPGQRPTHLTYGPDNYVYSSTRGMDTLYVDPWLRNAEGYAALTFDRYPIAEASVLSYEVIEGQHFVRIEGDMLLAESLKGIDSIEVYSPSGVLCAKATTYACPLKNIARGIYAARVRMQNGEAITCKFVY